MIDVTRHDFVVTAADLARVGPDAETRWYIGRVNPKCEARAKAGFDALRIPAYYPQETRYRGRGAARRKVSRPILVGYVFFQLRPGRSFWEVRRIDGVKAVVFGQNGAPAPVPHAEVARFARKEAEGRYDHTRDAKEARDETQKLQAKLGDLQAMGEQAIATIMAALKSDGDWDQAA